MKKNRVLGLTVSFIPALLLALLLANAFFSVFGDTVNDHIFTDLFARVSYIDAPILRSYLADMSQVSNALTASADWSVLSQIPLIGTVLLAFRDTFVVLVASGKLILGVLQVAFQLLTAVL